MSFTIDVKPLLTKQILRRKKENVAAAIRRGILFATNWLEGQIVEDQMSGRVREDYGLNRQSGRLAGSWRHKITNIGTTIAIKIFPLMFYAKFHQRPGPNSKTPKRLYVVEYFKANAKKIYFQEISDALKSKGRRS